MYHMFSTLCKNILHAFSFQGVADILPSALVEAPARILKTVGLLRSENFPASTTFSAIALRVTGRLALAVSSSFMNPPSPLSSPFLPVPDYLLKYFNDGFSSSTRYIFEIALAHNNLQQLGQSITMPSDQIKLSQPYVRRTPLLLIYKPVDAESVPPTINDSEASSETEPAALLLALLLVILKPVDVEPTSAAEKIPAAKRPQPLLLITYKPVEVDETSATRKEGSDEKFQKVEVSTGNSVEVEDASAQEQFVDVSETSTIETPEDLPSTPVPVTHDDFAEVEDISASEAPQTAPSTSTSMAGWRESAEDDLEDPEWSSSDTDLGDEPRSEIGVEVSAEDLDFLAEAFASVTLQDDNQGYMEEVVVVSESSAVVAADSSTTQGHDVVDTAREESEAAMEVDKVDLKRGADELDSDGTEPVYTRRFTKSRKVFANSSVATGFAKFCRRMALDGGPCRGLGDFRLRVGRNARDQADQERRRNAVLKAKRAARIRYSPFAFIFSSSILTLHSSMQRGGLERRRNGVCPVNCGPVDLFAAGFLAFIYRPFYMSRLFQSPPLHT
ncbi:hypothetical protein D9613_001548 [Agrocybe pediades]|uniref:Uncharacterized protein n=1 Tax=Agrocybe pediades TaxID=84607 RepID=A0A8H4R526_9AGAR|nr:hypothetical protein D9613_001548 [Agrocybe pediades]